MASRCIGRTETGCYRDIFGRTGRTESGSRIPGTDDGELIETLQAYLDCDKSANKAAEKLYVNYRTLSGRLKKIKDISGIDFKNSAEMLAVRNGIVLFKMAETL